MHDSGFHESCVVRGSSARNFEVRTRSPQTFNSKSAIYTRQKACRRDPRCARVQLEVGVNSMRVVSFCPMILSEKRTTKTPKTSKKQRQRDSLLRPTHGPALRARAALSGRYGKTLPSTNIDCALEHPAFSHSARTKPLAGGRPCVGPEAYPAKPRINRHSLKEKLLVVFEKL